MHSARLPLCLASSLLLLACIPAPSFELPSATSDDPFETDGPYTPTTDTEEGGDGLEDDTGDDTTGGESGDDDSSGPWDPSDSTSGSEGTTTFDPGGSSGETGAGGEDTTTGAQVEPAFPPAETFGDDTDEVALVGSWTVAWNPDGTPHWNLDIEADGSFVWTEAAASCNAVAVASGVLWVEGKQLVLHLETWDKRDPWPVESVVGEPLQLPFRLHLDFAMALGMLSISGPWELTAMLGWEGRVYRRPPGVGPAGVWTSTASLEAILAGEDSPRVIATDTYTMETAAGAQAFETTQRTWTHGESPVVQPAVVENFAWWNLTPGQPQGIIAIGGLQHLFDAERLVAYDQTRIFSKEAPQGCN